VIDPMASFNIEFNSGSTKLIQCVDAIPSDSF